MRYRRKLTTVEAYPWQKNGDHPLDCAPIHTDVNGMPQVGEGKVVRYFRRPDRAGNSLCLVCGKTMDDHGWIDRPGKDHDADDTMVCPGDMVLTHDDGTYHAMNGDLFWSLYESA